MSLRDKALEDPVTVTRDRKQAVELTVRRASHDDGGPQVDIAVTWQEPDPQARMRLVSYTVPRSVVVNNWDSGQKTFKDWVLAAIDATG